MTESRTKPQACYCCGQSLTYTRKPLPGGTTPPEGPGSEGGVESWECMNQECIIYRRTHPKIPPPPLSK